VSGGTFMDQDFLFMCGIIVFFTGAFSLSLSGMCYRWRAFLNKKAWDGLTLPFLYFGLPLVSIGLILIYFYYPY
jgi:hypothetical protein